MRFAVKRTQSGEFAHPDVLVALVDTVRELGYDSFWLGDHIAFPAGMDTSHKKGAWRTDPDQDFLEAISTAGFLLGRVPDLPIGIHAMIAPYRNPVVAGKAIASLDQLSCGRFRLALAAGWIEELFPVVGAPDFAQRGEVLEEYVTILRAMWREGYVEFYGEHYTIGSTRTLPRPAGGRDLPILLGGHAPAAVRRAGRLGDGWAAARLTPAAVADGLQRLKREAVEAGRDPDVLEVVVEADLGFDASMFDPGLALVGDLDRIRESVLDFEAAGVDLLVLNPHSETPRQVMDDVRRFATDIAGLSGGSTR